MTARADESIGETHTAGIPVAPPHPLRSVVVPSMGQCILAILALKLLLRVCGLWRTIAWIERSPLDPQACAKDRVAAVRATEHAVAMAAALYPGRALCLEQSLALYYVLRRQMVPVSYCQGVQAQPFQAHAWVELDGEPINDMPERIKRFARLHH